MAAPSAKVAALKKRSYESHYISKESDQLSKASDQRLDTPTYTSDLLAFLPDVAKDTIFFAKEYLSSDVPDRSVLNVCIYRMRQNSPRNIDVQYVYDLMKASDHPPTRDWDDEEHQKRRSNFFGDLCEWMKNSRRMC